MQESESSSRNKKRNECSSHRGLKSRSSLRSQLNARKVSQTSCPCTVPTARNRKAERRKSAALTVKPAFLFKSRHLTSRHSSSGKDSREPDPSGLMSPARIVGSEERRAMHREHERQRHQSLNDAMQELVNILPPTNTPKSITKYNVLQKANDYIDFLQHKIAGLCLELGIEHTVQDGRMSFSVPLSTILGEEELLIPASTAISPKLLQGFHKAARSVSMGQPAGKGTTQPDKRMSPPMEAKNKVSPEKCKIRKEETTNVGSLDKEVQCEPKKPASGTVHVEDLPTITASLGTCASQFSRDPDVESKKSPEQHQHSSWLKKIRSPYTSPPPSFNQQQRKKLLDHYIHIADSSSDQGYAVPTVPEPGFSTSLPELMSTLDPVSSTCTTQMSNTPHDHLHSEHSYSARYLPTCIPSATKAVAPSVSVSVEGTSQIPHSESKMTTPVNQGLVNPPTNSVTSSLFMSPVYVHQQPISFPIKVTSEESTNVPVSLASSNHLTQTTTSMSSVSKNTIRYVPIQPANRASNHNVVSVLPTAVTFHGTSSENSAVKETLPSVTQASVQELVLDPNHLYLEDSSMGPLNSLSVVTSTATSTCSIRRSWMNGYQLFTKVNHPRFRDKWPRLQGREITRLLSQAWKELPSDYKNLYSRRARNWNQWHRTKRKSANAKHTVTEE